MGNLLSMSTDHFRHSNKCYKHRSSADDKNVVAYHFSYFAFELWLVKYPKLCTFNHKTSFI